MAGGARGADNAFQLSAGIKAPKGESDGRCRSETRSARRSREQAVERVTKPCGRKVPGAGRARVNRTSVAACVERKESPREELAHLCRLASSVQGPEGRRNLRRGARAETKPSTRERTDGKASRPGSETINGAEDSGEPSRPDTNRSHRTLNKIASSRGNADFAATRDWQADG